MKGLTITMGPRSRFSKINCRAWAPLSLLAMLLLCMLTHPLEAEAVRFKLNELGYHPKASKYLVIEDLPEGVFQQSGVKVVLFSTDKKDLKPFMKERVLFTPTVKQVYHDPNTTGPQTTQALIDFSEFTQAGTYYIRVEGLGADKKAAPVSPSLKINEFIYWDTLKPVVKTFYFQRCGQSIGDVASGLNHYACHIKDAEPQEASNKNKLDVAGGWHTDSGYEKRTASTSLSVNSLLSLYEWNPKPFVHFKLDYPTSETFSILPDLLHEAKVGLDWLMVMQRNDGAFYEKVATGAAPGYLPPLNAKSVRPDEDLEKRFLYPPSLTDTASATAILAKASRVYKKKDMGYSIKALRDAEKGWQYLTQNPSTSASGLNKTEPGKLQQSVLTQWTRSDLSYRVWAAAELYLSSRKPVYHQFFLKNWPKVSTEPDARKNPAMLGMMDYLLYAGAEGDAQGYSQIEAVLKSRADELVDMVGQSAFGVPFQQYQPGSNLQLVNYTQFLLTMYKVTGDSRYMDSANRSFNFLFGMNPSSKTFVSGFGSNPVSKLAYTQSVVTKKVPPGFLVLGPNPLAEDGKTPKGLGFKSYMDNAAAYDSNATTNEGNAALACVLGMMNNLYNLESSSPLMP
jgi:endoglucanase